MMWILVLIPSHVHALDFLYKRGAIDLSVPLYFVPSEGREDGALYVTFPSGISLLKDGLQVGGVKISFGEAKEVKALYPTEAKFNYFKGKDPTRWRRNVPGFKAVAYREVYPGIDLVITGKGKGALEFQWIVKAGADPGRVALKVEGGKIVVKGEDAYVVRDGKEVIKISSPRAYQGAEEVEVRQVLTEGALTYRLGDYDPSHRLVIDPDLSSLAASTFLGGSLGDYITSIAIDRSRNVVVAGYTHSSDFPTTPGAYDNSLNDSTDAFVAIFSPDLSSLLEATFLGGTSYDNIGAVAIDDAGNVVVAGQTYSSDFPTTSGSYDNTFEGYSDAFVSVLSPDLSSLISSTFLGGGEGEEIKTVAIDGSGNIVVAGQTYSSDFPTTSGSYDNTFEGYSDAFVSVLSPDLSSLTYSTFLGGGGDDGINAVGVDALGNIIVAGQTSSSDFPTTSGSYDNTYNGNDDAFVSVFGTITSVEERAPKRSYDYILEGKLLKITLEKPAYVGLSIYSPDGRLINRITAGYLPAGRHVLNLPDLPSGTYTVRMRVGDKSRTFKVLGNR